MAQQMPASAAANVAAKDLRKKIALAKADIPVSPRPAFGESPIPTAAAFVAAAYAKVYASISTVSDRDIWQAKQFVSQITHKVTIRYRDDVNAGDVVVYGSRIFRIEAQPNPMERNVRLDLLCIEIGDGTVVST